MKYKIGDKLRVVKDDDGVHCFKVGDIVTVVYIYKKDALRGGLLCVRESDEMPNGIIPDIHAEPAEPAEPVETRVNKIKKFFKIKKR